MLATPRPGRNGWDGSVTANAKIDFEPDRTFVAPFLGTYRNPLYGTSEIRFDAKNRAVLDTGEWTSNVGKKKEEDGTEKLVNTSAAWLGWPELVREDRNGKVSLWFQDGQRKVVFERVPGQK